MKQFNLEEYIKNPERKVVTRDGRKVTRFLCTDAKLKFPIIALVEATPGSTMECLRTYTKDGNFFIDQISPNDLFFAPTKHEGWVNIFKDVFSGNPSVGDSRVFKSKEDAEKNGKSCNDYIASVKIKWEE